MRTETGSHVRPWRVRESVYCQWFSVCDRFKPFAASSELLPLFLANRASSIPLEHMVNHTITNETCQSGTFKSNKTHFFPIKDRLLVRTENMLQKFGFSLAYETLTFISTVLYFQSSLFVLGFCRFYCWLWLNLPGWLMLQWQDGYNTDVHCQHCWCGEPPCGWESWSRTHSFLAK